MRKTAHFFTKPKMRHENAVTIQTTTTIKWFNQYEIDKEGDRKSKRHLGIGDWFIVIESADLSWFTLWRIFPFRSS